MKALTLHQPRASLVARNLKTIETRSWTTNYRGPLAIHAAQRSPIDGVMAIGRAGYVVTDWEDLPLGAVVATCELVDVVPIVGWDAINECPASDGARKVVTIDPDEDEDGRRIVRVWMFGEIERPLLGCWSGAMGSVEAEFGDYTPGRFAWLLEAIKPLREPAACRGRQGLWNWVQP